jgi:vacuolar-type H+-ATPase subunit I/STV1
MHNPTERTDFSPLDKRTDRSLWIALFLGPLAMGINTIVGYIVAHWTTDTNQKSVLYLVSAIDFVLCLTGMLISLSIYRRYGGADELAPIDGRRFFMSHLAILLSILSALLVIAGTIAVVALHPTD